MNNQLAVSQVNALEATRRFADQSRLAVRQRKRWLEVLLSFEMKNAYDVYDSENRPVLRVREQGEGVVSLLKRLFLGPMRPLVATVDDLATSNVVLTLKRPFRWMFHRLEVYSGSGEYLGAIQKQWSWIRRMYTIENASGAVVAELFGPVFKPWTFEIRCGGQMRGAIRKRWSGLGRELFTDADNFAVELGELPDATLKTLAFAATVLIDVVHFERAKG